MTKIRDELFKKLRSIYDDKDFVVGIMSSAKTEDDAKKSSIILRTVTM